MMRKPCLSLRARPLSILTVSVFYVLVAIVTLVPASLPAQMPIPPEALPDESGFERVLGRGRELEAQQRWGEALSHYEGVLREFPDRRDLHDCLTRARIHFDLGRRYEDRSYIASLNSMTERQASELYGEILGKIESYYYKKPDWQEVARRGISSLDIALTRACFCSKNRVQTPVEIVNAFRSEIRQRMEVTTVRSQRQAHEVAAHVANIAARQIGLPTHGDVYGVCLCGRVRLGPVLVFPYHQSARRHA